MGAISTCYVGSAPVLPSYLRSAVPQALPSVPILETKRLRLRGHRVEDLASSSAMWGDPENVRHISARPFTSEECWGRILRYFGLWAALGFGYWVIEQRSSGHFIGEVGFVDYKRDIVPALNGAPEAGWIIAPGFHGKGYAQEAMSAALGWLDGAQPHTRSVCIIDPSNTASLKLAAKLGYVEYARTTYTDHVVTLHERAAA